MRKSTKCYQDLLDVGYLNDPIFAENAIDKLVLDGEKTKDMIKAICTNYSRRDHDDRYSADFIPGKGRGRSCRFLKAQSLRDI